MSILDALGQPCPIPVVKAKKALAALPPEGGSVEILVDNQTACENLAKMADGSGYAHETRQLADGTYLVAIRSGTGGVAKAACLPSSPGLVAVIGSDCMGRGSEELGKILVKGFLFSLAQLDPVPQAALFFNSGVRLVREGANTVEDVRTLADKGGKVLVCGTCADYYQCRENIAVGEIVTMYDIVDAMNSGQKIVSV